MKVKQKRWYKKAYLKRWRNWKKIKCDESSSFWSVKVTFWLKHSVKITCHYYQSNQIIAKLKKHKIA